MRRNPSEKPAVQVSMDAARGLRRFLDEVPADARHRINEVCHNVHVELPASGGNYREELDAADVQDNFHPDK